MDLLCVEQLNMIDSCVAERDRVIFKDMRVLENLLQLERVFMPSCNYFGTVQKDIQPFMRKVVALWMMEVCEEQQCENQVFPLSVNFLDRFLCTVSISRHQLQLAAAVCLLLATKTRQCQSLTVELLSYCSDHSITTDQIKSWELLLLSKLQWNVTAVTGFDYVDHVLERVSWSKENLHVRRHAHTFVGLCYVEPDFILKPGSLLASAAICSALRGLRIPSSATAVAEVCALTRVHLDDVEPIVLHIERLIEQETATESTQLTAAVTAAAAAAAAATNKSAALTASTNSGKFLSGADESGHPETPTDMTDVHF